MSQGLFLGPRMFLLAGTPRYQLIKLQAVMNSAGRHICGRNKFDHVSRVLCDRLHWLPVEQRIEYTLCLLVYKVQCGLTPQYLVDLCQPVSAVSGRSGLRSSTHGDLVVVRTETDFGECSFAVAAPLAWNRLPEKIRNLRRCNCLSLVSRLTCSAALPDTGKQDIDTDIVTADISRPCNGFAMLRRVIN